MMGTEHLAFRFRLKSGLCACVSQLSHYDRVANRAELLTSLRQRCYWPAVVHHDTLKVVLLLHRFDRAVRQCWDSTETNRTVRRNHSIA